MYGAAAMSGAFSGLLAAGIAEMRGQCGLAGWQWIFILVRHPCVIVNFHIRTTGGFHRQV